jgi:hypothetical protein
VDRRLLLGCYLVDVSYDNDVTSDNGERQLLLGLLLSAVWMRSSVSARLSSSWIPVVSLDE